MRRQNNAGAWTNWRSAVVVARLVRFMIHLLTGNLAEVIAVSTGAAIISLLCFGSTQLWHVFNMRSSSSTLLVNEISRNRFVWIAISIGAGFLLSATYIPPTVSMIADVSTFANYRCDQVVPTRRQNGLRRRGTTIALQGQEPGDDRQKLLIAHRLGDDRASPQREDGPCNSAVRARRYHDDGHRRTRQGSGNVQPGLARQVGVEQQAVTGRNPVLVGEKRLSVGVGPRLPAMQFDQQLGGVEDRFIVFDDSDGSHG